VHFEDGRVLKVAGVEPQGDMIRLSLAGGGVISVPSWRVVDWQEVAKREPEATPKIGRSDSPWRRVAGSYAEHIERAARVHSVDPVLLTAVARTESNFDPLAVSPKGALGLMQLMPQTAERFGVADVFDVSDNVDGGARYLSWLLDRFDGQTELALAGYNAGEGAVDRYSGVPPYPETENYVEKVMREAARMGSEPAQPEPNRGQPERPERRAATAVSD
jgi:soluble lytic murein transglycosylase-like protein